MRRARAWSGLIGVVLGAGLATHSVASPPVAEDPARVAEGVHADGGYPSTLEIGDAPRWTSARAPLVILRGQVTGGSSGTGSPGGVVGGGGTIPGSWGGGPRAASRWT